jgi:hypothetical protein
MKLARRLDRIEPFYVIDGLEKHNSPKAETRTFHMVKV